MEIAKNDRIEAILEAAQGWANVHTAAGWDRLLGCRSREAVYLRAAVYSHLRAAGCTLAQIGGLFCRNHESVLNCINNIPFYRFDKQFTEIEEGIRQAIESHNIQPTTMFQATVSGNLARDCESREIKGKDYTVFTIGVDAGKNDTQWVKVNYYGTGKVRDLLRKGAKVVCSGRLSVGVYNDKPDITLWADLVEVTKFAADERPEAARPAPQSQEEDENKGDDLPF